MRTLILGTVPVLVCKKVNDPISQTHSLPLQQSVTMNCDEPLSLSNCHPFQFFTSINPPSVQKPTALCLLQLLCAGI